MASAGAGAGSAADAQRAEVMAVLAGAQPAGEGDGSRAAKLLKLPFMARAAERHRLEAQARPCLIFMTAVAFVSLWFV